jgi:hypothetical protein
MDGKDEISANNELVERDESSDDESQGVESSTTGDEVTKANLIRLFSDEYKIPVRKVEAFADVLDIEEESDISCDDIARLRKKCEKAASKQTTPRSVKVCNVCNGYLNHNNVCPLIACNLCGQVGHTGDECFYPGMGVDPGLIKKAGEKLMADRVLKRAEALVKYATEKKLTLKDAQVAMEQGRAQSHSRSTSITAGPGPTPKNQKKKQNFQVPKQQQQVVMVPQGYYPGYPQFVQQPMVQQFQPKKVKQQQPIREPRILTSTLAVRKGQTQTGQGPSSFKI